jgi:hypothetical protein
MFFACFWQAQSTKAKVIGLANAGASTRFIADEKQGAEFRIRWDGPNRRVGGFWCF